MSKYLNTDGESSKLNSDFMDQEMKTSKIVEDFEIQNGELTIEIKETLKKKNLLLLFLYSVDLLFCFLISGPCVVAFWRLVWNFHDLFLDGPVFDRDNLTISNLWAIFVGLFGTFFIDVFHHNFAASHFLQTPFQLSMVSKTFSVLWGILDVTYWKGVWDGINLWVGTEIQVPSLTLVIGMLFLIVLRSVKTGICAPVGISIDDPRNIFHCGTYLESSSESSIHRKLVDGVLSRFVKLNAILFWHGIWNLSSILTEEYWGLSTVQSAWVSLGSGFGAALFLFISQYGLLRLEKGLVFNLLFIGFNIIGVFATVSSFRGVWYLLDTYFLPDNNTFPTPSSIMIAGVIGTLLLLLLGCGSSLRAPVVRDKPTQGVLLPFFYSFAFYIRNKEAEN